MEEGNRATEIVLDMDQIQQLADQRPESVGDLLSRFRQAGATAVAISEPTIQQLIDSGDVSVFTPEIMIQMFPELGPRLRTFDFILTTSRPDLGEQIREQLAAKCPRAPETLLARNNTLLLGIHGGVEALGQIGVGMIPEQVAAARGVGLRVVARLTNYPSVTRKAVDFMIDEAHRRKAEIAIFGGDEVLGYKDLLKEVAARLERDGVLFGSVEFTKQRGDGELARLLEYRSVRVHSINQTELYGLSPLEAVQRFVRGVKERNIRVCYLRLLPQPKAHIVEDNLAYVHELATELRQGGYPPGTAHSLARLAAPGWARAFAALGVAAAAALLLQLLFATSESLTALAFACGVVVCGGAAFASAGIGAKIVALVAAAVFPALGLVSGALPELLRRPAAADQSQYTPVKELLRASAITMVGALAIVALLANYRYMLKTDQFAGVKFAQLLPLFIVAVAYVGDLLPNRATLWSVRRNAAMERFRQLFDRPILIKQAVALIFLLAFLAIWMARSGNEPGVGVSNIELRFRSLLEQLLIARPRSKEFLFAHPAFLLAVALALRGRMRWVIPLTLVGSIGQISMLNTFCHIHTPLSLSVLRTFNGLWLGIVIGAFAVSFLNSRWIYRFGPPERRLDAVWQKTYRRTHPPEAPPEET